MRFNSKELISIATQPSYKFNKEGVLTIKEKHESFFRKSDAFCPRWCRLRGNLLFYFKSADQYSEPAGVYVLEQFSVTDSNELPHGFNLVFKGEEHPQLFAASSSSDKASWVQALQTASFEYLKTELASLVEKVKQKKADADYLLITQKCISKRHRCFTFGSSYDPQHLEPFMELSLSCDNLKCDGSGEPPNPLVCVSINNPPSATWTKFAQTEMIEKSSNPCFLTTVTFSKEDVSEISKIKFSVYDVREKVTSTGILLGEAIFTLYTLLKSDHSSLRLTLLSSACASVGFITVFSRELRNIPQKNEWLQLAEEDILWSKVERPRSYSLPTRLISQTGIPVLGQLRTLCTNFTSQTYRFHTGLGAELYVHEIMAESRLSFSVPVMLLNLWINEEKKLMDSILQLGKLSGEWHQKQLAAIESHLHLINHYTEVSDLLATQKQTSFKPSVLKFDPSLEFVPVNLHLQRIWVQNVTTRKTAVYDIITVGAFSAFSQSFSQGGLLRLLNHLKTYSPYVSKENGSAVLGPDPVSRSAEAIKRIDQLQGEIEKDLQNIVTCTDEKTIDFMQTALNSLSSKGNQLIHIFIPRLVEDVLALWEVIQNSERTKSVAPSSCELLNSFKHEVDIKNDVITHSESKQEFENTTFSDIVSKNDTKQAAESVCSNANINGNQLMQLSSAVSNETLSSVPCNFSAGNAFDDLEPLELIHLNIQASIMCISCKVQSFVQQNTTSVKKEQPEENIDWTAELKPSIEKLRHALNCLQKTANLSYGIISLKESTNSLLLSQNVRYRRDIVFSQTLTSLVTGLMIRLWCQYPDAMFIYMLKTVGVLAQFEGLLSCYGNEMGALEDMVVGVDDLRRVSFWLEPSKTDNPQPRIEGNRLYLSVIIPAPQSVMNLLPKKTHRSCRFTVCSVFFNIGINEQASFAERFGDMSLQEKINQDSLNLLKDHFSRFQRAVKASKNQGFRISEGHVTDLLEQMQNHISGRKSKNVELLHAASEVCRHLGGIRFTSCKSAKDRTAMSVTLEQTMVLLKDFNLDENEKKNVLACMRSEGTRRENALKNVGVRKYAFGGLQLLTIPKLYRPPPGTYGSVQT